ncbi:bifunctional diaminohydroxyphosphoribosylaminopyrimidine deaminase/5-amino-6-(5-phosphoribosylamino)uracil reductase RibD [Seonamhaeicola marinus]|uniref:Riboflavin biosynthesis protein RibD n=1 Tax=Seonamhaeicola marinus TaxID=1912246 RepID=A0A5D0HJC1_9FLAO|nr:bifunctional diaminohydroxyphosphoribosylaminopyrimidine deaminase/5-amino-6-(5-phosphoribosylamino)uracil reductase RibD [Seonamhaeicola marinus]TYA71483.1 bifunctional diaminohydroxyphosphoribosylaminopyrimidine deaminase/5-amino-6-(5-phosphoribosylamino)uracil reductase RibD [Seonamhaeicola marinus]
MNSHEFYIKRCIKIGKNGLGSTRPNPMVGAVIVRNNTIIGEGFTSPYGGPHAEVNAINAVKDKELLKSATIYVTLEPCSHYGKTPPCSDLIIRHQIPNVVIGCIDDNEQVAGKGVKKLKDAGVNVVVGVLEKECKEHHKRFFTFHNKKRPYIILKWAETNNGFIAPESKNEQKPVWISNTYSRQLTHKWRTEEQAILVGTNTVLQDNPTLTARDWTGQNPIRVVIDKDLKLNKNLNIFNDKAETLIIHGKNNSLSNGNETQKGWSIHPPIGYENVILSEIDFSKKNAIAQQICEVLFRQNINSIIIEGGQKTLQTFINEDLWDEARVFTGDVMFKEGTKAPKFNGQQIFEETIGSDTLKIYTKYD